MTPEHWCWLAQIGFDIWLVKTLIDERILREHLDGMLADAHASIHQLLDASEKQSRSTFKVLAALTALEQFSRAYQDTAQQLEKMGLCTQTAPDFTPTGSTAPVAGKEK